MKWNIYIRVIISLLLNIELFLIICLILFLNFVWETWPLLLLFFFHFLLVQAIKYFSNNKEYFEKLVQNFMIFMARGGGTESNSSVAFAIVNWVLERHGIQHAREIYNRYAAISLFFRFISLISNNLCLMRSFRLKMAESSNPWVSFQTSFYRKGL